MRLNQGYTLVQFPFELDASLWSFAPIESGVHP